MVFCLIAEVFKFLPFLGHYPDAIDLMLIQLESEMISLCFHIITITTRKKRNQLEQSWRRLNYVKGIFFAQQSNHTSEFIVSMFGDILTLRYNRVFLDRTYYSTSKMNKLSNVEKILADYKEDKPNELGYGFKVVSTAYFKLLKPEKGLNAKSN